MNKTANTLKNVTATAVLAVSAFIGTTALSTTTVVTTTAVISMTHSSTAEAALVCRDQPVDTRHLKHPRQGRYFYYQPMKKKGVFGKCKKAGGVTKIKMLAPRLPSGVKLKSGGLSRFDRMSDGCSGGGTRGRKLFHAACVAHDICYSSMGVPKFKCEDLFLANMLKISKHAPVGSRVKALSFTTAVGVAARSHYAKGQNWAKRNYK